MKALMRAVGLGAMVMVTGILQARGEAFQPFQPLPPFPPAPADNPASPAKIELGKQLFFDRRLSPQLSHSCLSCHNVLSHGSDERAAIAGAGGQTSRRSPPTLWNVGYNTIYFRDGRGLSLEQAIQMHMLEADAMAMGQEAHLTARLQAIPGYVTAFRVAFGPGPITLNSVGKALAAYLRTLNTQDSPWDRYLRGDAEAISAEAKKGFGHFVETGCASCHFWVQLAGPVPGLAFEMGQGFYELFPNYKGSEYDKKYRLTDDPGRIQVTRDATDQHMWRVSGLRNVAVTAPYFHNGSVATLDEAVRVMSKTQLNKELSSAHVADIVAFLQTLTGEFPHQTFPHLPLTVNHATGTMP